MWVCMPACTSVQEFSISKIWDCPFENHAPNDTAPYCRRRGSSSTTFLYIGRPKDNQNRAEIRCTFHWQSLVILAAKLMASRTIKNIFRKNLPGNTSYKPETGKFKDRPSYFAVPFFNTPNSFREISRLNFWFRGYSGHINWNLLHKFQHKR